MKTKSNTISQGDFKALESFLKSKGILSEWQKQGIISLRPRLIQEEYDDEEILDIQQNGDFYIFRFLPMQIENEMPYPYDEGMTECYELAPRLAGWSVRYPRHIPMCLVWISPSGEPFVFERTAHDAFNPKNRI